MAYIIGIDLGTSNSVACVYRRGTVETIPVDGHNIMPSAISVREDGSVMIGTAAKSRASLQPADSITSSKRFIGDGTTEWLIRGRKYTPIDAGALILRRLKEAAEAFLREPVNEVVVTVPAYFNINQRRDTKLAGEKAGLNVLKLLQEPSAAAVSYAIDRGSDQTIVVYDLGGGTFDVSVLRVKGNNLEVVAVDGDFHLGGDDFDRLLALHLASLLQRRPGSDLDMMHSILSGELALADSKIPRDMRIAVQRLEEAAERAKIELAEADSTIVSVSDILHQPLEAEVTLKQYNSLIAPLVESTVEKIKAVLSEAHLTPADIDRVLLVGGSTRNKLVKQRVAEALKEPWTSDHVDEAVARGAALVAGTFSTPSYEDVEEDSTLPEIVLQDVTPFNLGIRAKTGDDPDLFSILIPKNTKIPYSREERYTTIIDNQSAVDIDVYQGDDIHCKENIFIGGFVLEGIPPGPVGVPDIMVRFHMDGSDLLTVSASCSDKQATRTLDVNMISRADDKNSRSRQADIIFLVDTSGSMTGELNGVQASCTTFANQVISAGVQCRLGLMDFDKGVGKPYQWEVFGPMVPGKFSQSISGLRIGRLGGVGCYVGTPDTVPVIKAFADAFPSPDRMKIGILISDEVGNDVHAVNQIVSLLKDGNVCLYVLGVKGSCHEKLAKETGGRFWNIHESRGHVDFSELLKAIAVEITNLARR